MSKMSQAHAELEEQAYEYGFNSLQEALDTGAYEVVYGPYRAYLDKKLQSMEPQLKAQKAELEERYKTLVELNKAHEAWLKEKEVQLERLDAAVGYLEMIKEAEVAKIVKDAVDFIKKGEQ